MGDFGKDITGILTLIIGIAALALVLAHASGFSSDIGALSGAFTSSLGAAEAPANGGGGATLSMSDLTGAGGGFNTMS